MKIAIIGGGLSGATALKTLLSHPNLKKEDRIDVYEPREVWGVGLPYGPDDESLMLNVSPDYLSVDENDPLDFLKWLKANYEKPLNDEGLVSRPKFGYYLAERFEPYFKHDQVTHIQTTVLDIDVLDADTKKQVQRKKTGQYVYRLQTGEGAVEDHYDAVFLALGHPEYADYYNLKGKVHYVSNPYPVNEKLSQIDPDERIGIIGSGATGIDLMRFFSRNYDLKHPLTFYVQDQGFYFVDIPYENKPFKFTFSKEWIAEEKANGNGLIPFTRILSTFIQDIKAEGVDVLTVYDRYKKGDLGAIKKAIDTNDQDLALIQTYTSKLVSLLPSLFNSLSGHDKKAYLSNYYNKLLFFKSRVPYRTMIWLLDLMKRGKVKLVYGLEEITALKDGSFILHANEEETADRLINATGFETRLLELGDRSPLIYNLVNKKIIIPDQNGRYVLIDWPQAQVLNQEYGTMNGLFFYGLLVGGTQHGNNDAPLTYQLASESASWFMDQRKA
ncbi:FAD/NAD(P)-binding protein [Alkalibacterium kapii]|uniref:Pyridine nucleotide-disulfide oxidoreductase n=1 Tax=Alkalibacterium kapii TaxID=426704 RepID=A0A511AV77_9LACT|nr:FAD/NAD(P)-binding protein [Alkalibacterium kapii]GEK91253.1 pyridine nucleotide-disulfide oxidoreductase [Alkalibacterium kapii]